ncbi:MAG: hypothetical protein WD554_03830 [Flavobacteriaceae bacterium]
MKNDGALTLTIISWFFGLLFLAIGIINTFWGNDSGFGVFIILLSLVYLLPVNIIFKNITGFTIPGLKIIKVLLGIFILWAAMGVGELGDKIELMMMDIKSEQNQTTLKKQLRIKN